MISQLFKKSKATLFKIAGRKCCERVWPTTRPKENSKRAIRWMICSEVMPTRCMSAAFCFSSPSVGLNKLFATLLMSLCTSWPSLFMGLPKIQ
jgi:VanZ family protein